MHCKSAVPVAVAGREFSLISKSLNLILQLNMELIEREGFLSALHNIFNATRDGEGHTVFVCGEAGIGKTSLVKKFSKEINRRHKVLLGTCDALFAPRPLAPVYDILLGLRNEKPAGYNGVADRAEFFTDVFLELKKQDQSFLIVFEDIHWADEATLDFIKFLARRITQLPCLFILTYRDNEIHPKHPLRNVLGQLIPGSFTKMELPLLSRQAVEKLADARGISGKDIYSISGGNPFYVCELLASYNEEIPDSIRDSILSAYNNCDEKSKTIWNILSVIPTAFEVDYLKKIIPDYEKEAALWLHYKILVVENNCIAFKHELFRKTIESILSPFEKIEIHRNILREFLPGFEANNEIERIVHHAKNANEYELVVRYAPIAARKAANLGAHIEAAKLYFTAIEYYQQKDKDVLVQLYEAYAYECYLTNQVKEAIIYTARSYDIWKEKGETEKIGNSLRFLSRLWWFDGNRKNAERYAELSIAAFDKGNSSKAHAMALSNMSQLYMLADKIAASVSWGEKAIAMAKEINDVEILAHALNNVGTVLSNNESSRQKGLAMLQESLDISLNNEFQEHVARAYTNQGSLGVKFKLYEFSEKALTGGIQYCEERDLNSWTTYMLSWKSRLYLETGKWTEAYSIAEKLLAKETYPPVRISVLVVKALIQMRKGEGNPVEVLQEAYKLAIGALEVQRLIPVLTACLEWEWLTGSSFVEQKDFDSLVNMIRESDNSSDNNSFIFWLLKTRDIAINDMELSECYKANNSKEAKKSAMIWEKLGCPYEQAIMLFETDEEGKREALSIMLELGAEATAEKLKQQMRDAGIKSIPRGMRKSTQSNPANLTQREIDIVTLLKDGLQNKEIADKLYISPKTVDHHISSILFKLDVNSRSKAAQEASRLGIIK